MSAARYPAPRASGLTRSTAVPLHWAMWGPEGGPRLVVLHGGPGASHDYLLPQFLDLADEFEMLFYDQRGGGRSKTDDGAPITWRTHVGDLERIVDEFAVEPLTIIGYSWGALLALLYAIEASADRVHPAPARLALVDPAPVTRAFREQFEAEFGRRQRGPDVQRLRDALAVSGLRDSDPAAYRQRAFELSVAGYFAVPSLAIDLTPFRITGRVQQSVWHSLGEYDLVDPLESVQCPAIIVHGRQDPIPLAASQAAARALRAELVTLDACGHVPYVEQREQLFAALRAFFHRTAVPPSPGAT